MLTLAAVPTVRPDLVDDGAIDTHLAELAWHAVPYGPRLAFPGTGAAQALNGPRHRLRRRPARAPGRAHPPPTPPALPAGLLQGCFAFDFADRHNAELVGLLVGRWDHRTGSDDARRGILSDAMSAWAERYPDVVAREEVTTAEHPADALLTTAVDADLLVVGVRGHGAVHTTCLGSVSHAVVHYAPCPVAVVR